MTEDSILCFSFLKTTPPRSSTPTIRVTKLSFLAFCRDRGYLLNQEIDEDKAIGEFIFDNWYRIGEILTDYRSFENDYQGKEIRE